jgi:hypothetical protein
MHPITMRSQPSIRTDACVKKGKLSKGLARICVVSVSCVILFAPASKLPRIVVSSCWRLRSLVLRQCEDVWTDEPDMTEDKMFR